MVTSQFLVRTLSIMRPTDLNPYTLIIHKIINQSQAVQAGIDNLANKGDQNNYK